MRPSWRVTVGSWAALAVLAAPHGAMAQLAPTERAILTEKEAILLAPPELVAGPNVGEAQWSPDGRYVLAQQMFIHVTPELVRSALDGAATGKRVEPGGEMGLILWSRRTGQSKVVWRGVPPHAMVLETHWLPSSAAAVVAVVEPDAGPAVPGMGDHLRLLRIDAASGTSRVLAVIPSASGIMLQSVGPDGTVILRQVEHLPGPPGPDGQARLRRAEKLVAVSPAGVLGSPIDVPDTVTVADIGWSQDGRAVLTCFPLGKQRTTSRYVLDPRTGRMAEGGDARPVPPPAPPEPAFVVAQAPIQVKRETTLQMVRPLWLELKGQAQQPRALLTADGDWSAVSPRGDAVLYRSQGALWAAAIVRLPRAAFDAARAAAQRTVAISNGKQVALCLLMYAQDFDEKLPSAAEFSTSILMPYAKTDVIFQGFVYSLQGGKLADYASPATTEMGYVPGPGGRAVVYLDGHVMWKAD